MSHPSLTDSEIAASIATLSGWTLAADGRAIDKTFVFGDFSEAFGFMTRVALAAEKLDHHPDWSNVWNTVRVRLSTHDAGGLTSLDFNLAAQIDAARGAP